MTTNYDKLRALLRELFQMDQADLDFGLYRIMNAKRGEIERFLEHDLLPQVKCELARHTTLDSGAKQTELAAAIEGAQKLGMNPDAVPKVQELRAQLKQGGDLDSLENEVFSHLYNFFRRYYHQGDFLSLRRYKEGVYAIPYEGEEVKLYWANHDQYYIKSTEYLRNYTFKLRDNRRVHLKVVEADTEADNNKPQGGKERRFSLAEAAPVAVENGELFIRFNYQADARKQTELNAAAVAAVLGNPALMDWLSELGDLRPTDKKPDRTLLAKHLDDFTARYAFDYFIHKDLGGFLRRELDFFIKNEIMHLDDVEDEAAPKVELYLSKIKALRKIAHKFIAFLEQLENFQKRLWLKKKFVVETNYCVTLDRVPEALYPEIAANDAQRAEWVQLFSINTIQNDLGRSGYSEPLTVEFLSGNPLLVLDTRHFPDSFKARLAASSQFLFADQPRCLVRGESLHALKLLAERCKSTVRCIYIDPPYNTGSDEFLYKDNYQHSSWVSFLFDRLTLGHALLAEDGALAVSIGEEELGTLQHILDMIFGRENRISLITVKRASVTGHKVINPGVVNVSEYALIYAKDRRTWTGKTIYAERERDDRYGTFVKNRDAAPGKWEFISVLDALAAHLKIEKRELRTHLGEQYEARLTQFVYDNAKAVCQPVTVDLGGVGAEFREWVAKSSAAGDEVLVYRREGLPESFLRNGKKLIFYSDKLTRIGKRLATAERASDIWSDVLPNDLHNEGGVDLPKGKKPEALLSRIIELTTDEGDLVLDFFAGTATAAAVAQKMNRRWVAVECSSYFDSKPLRRMKNTINGESRGVSEAFDWKGGGGFVVLHIESYEDCLNNLELKRTQAQDDLLTEAKDFREDYTLRYMLDVETRGSASLLNVQQFTDPFSYQLKVSTGTVGETKAVKVDLVETFNWLVGLTVKHMDHIRSVRVVEGTNPQGDRVLILWRNVAEVPNDKLDEWFKAQGYNTRDQEYDLIYVNGDNHLENFRRTDQTWKVRPIEEDFHRLMWECQDV